MFIAESKGLVRPPAPSHRQIHSTPSREVHRHHGYTSRISHPLPIGLSRTRIIASWNVCSFWGRPNQRPVGSGARHTCKHFNAIMMGEPIDGVGLFAGSRANWKLIGRWPFVLISLPHCLTHSVLSKTQSSRSRRWLR